MIDYFASQDIERDGETLTQWLARRLHETPTEARARLAQMQRAAAADETAGESTEGRAAA